MPQLLPPDVRVHLSYLAALGEYRAEGDYPDFDGIHVEDPAVFANYVAALRRDPRTSPGPRAPRMSLLWWTEGADYLGRISLWHELTGPWADYGHIGYDIRPSARGRGHATAMLAAALPVAARLGIDPARVRVSAQNHASRKVLEANGATLIRRSDSQLYYSLPTTGP